MPVHCVRQFVIPYTKPEVETAYSSSCTRASSVVVLHTNCIAENFGVWQKRAICKSFLPRKFPAIQYDKCMETSGTLFPSSLFRLHVLQKPGRSLATKALDMYYVS